jgi:hypothetical protein
MMDKVLAQDKQINETDKVWLASWRSDLSRFKFDQYLRSTFGAPIFLSIIVISASCDAEEMWLLLRLFCSNPTALTYCGSAELEARGAKQPSSSNNPTLFMHSSK